MAYAAAPAQVTYASAPATYAAAPVAYAAAPSTYEAQVAYAAAPAVTTAYAAAPLTYAAAPVAQAQAEVKAQVGVWLICQDAQGEFYQNATTGQQFDQAPPELLQQIQAQGGVY